MMFDSSRGAAMEFCPFYLTYSAPKVRRTGAARLSLSIAPNTTNAVARPNDLRFL